MSLIPLPRPDHPLKIKLNINSTITRIVTITLKKNKISEAGYLP